jgi:hypothetical protein
MSKWNMTTHVQMEHRKGNKHMSTWNTEKVTTHVHMEHRKQQDPNTHVVALSNAMSCALAIQFPLQLVLVLKARLSLVVKSVPVNVSCVSTYNPTCEGLDPVNSMTVTTSEPPVSA